LQKATKRARSAPRYRSSFWLDPVLRARRNQRVCIGVLSTVRRPPFPDLAAILILSNPRSLDRLGTMERRAGEAAVHIGAQRGARRNKPKNIDPEIKV
jgi:hypothetical protein